ncbi:hypothetical protein ACFPVS_08275 [Neisseria weixii]
MKTYFTISLILLLSASAGSLSGSSSEIYGEIKTGLETSHTRIAN